MGQMRRQVGTFPGRTSFPFFPHYLPSASVLSHCLLQPCSGVPFSVQTSWAQLFPWVGRKQAPLHYCLLLYDPPLSLGLSSECDFQVGLAVSPSLIKQPPARPELWPEDPGHSSGDGRSCLNGIKNTVCSLMKETVVYASASLGEIAFSACTGLVSEWAHRYEPLLTTWDLNFRNNLINL